MKKKKHTQSVKREKSEDLQDVQVRLKPIFGVRPGVYLLILYSAIVLLLFFLIFILPGIRRFGSLISFQSTPPGASVYVDDIRLGATPLETFVEAGSRKIHFKKADFDDTPIEQQVSGRLFFSLFFPKRLTVSAELQLTDLQSRLNRAGTEFAGWAMIGAGNQTYTFPPILEELASDIAAADGSADSLSADQFFLDIIQYVNNSYLARRYLSALALYCSEGKVFSPGSIARMARFFRILSRMYRKFPYWCAAILPYHERQNREKLEAWYTDYIRRFFDRNSFLNGNAAVLSLPLPSYQAGRMNFVGISGRSYLMGLPADYSADSVARDGYLPHIVSVDDFFISDREVSRGDYAQFIKSNPEWASENKAELIAAGLVTDDYLKDWHTEKDERLPVVNISFYAAQAYAEWFESELLGSSGMYTAGLPTDAEWELAAKLNRSGTAAGNFILSGNNGPVAAEEMQPGKINLRNMMGNVWEWCENWYFPAEKYLGKQQRDLSGAFLPAYGGLEKNVRGGAWINPEQSIREITIASQPADWCTDFLGFRLVLREKQDLN
jgi:formylglycine-generating enzyme required for sulfatase activity